MNRLLLQQTRSPVTQRFLGAAWWIGSCSISIICGAVSSERCCKALQHMSELILQHWLDATPHFKVLQGRKKPPTKNEILHWSRTRVSREEIPLFVNSKVCLFLADSLSASCLFTLLLLCLMCVSLCGVVLTLDQSASVICFSPLALAV